MQDLRENKIPEMREFAYSWTVVNHMQLSKNYLIRLEDQTMHECKTGNGFGLNPEVIPAYFAATMGLSCDRLFLAIMKYATRDKNNNNTHITGMESIRYGSNECHSIVEDLTFEGRMYTSSGECEYDELVEQLAIIINSFARISIYHHYDRELLKAVRENPISIMNLISTGIKVIPEEKLFFERLRIMIESMISISNPRWNSFSSD